MNEIISSLIASLGSSEGSPSFGDWAKKTFDQTAGGKAYNAFNQPDATISSIYNASQSKNPPMQQATSMQAPELQQGVIGAQNPTFAQNDYMVGIPSLLKKYGNSSQGLLPYFGAQ